MKKLLIHSIPIFTLSIVFCAAWFVNTHLLANAKECSLSNKCISGEATIACTSKDPCVSGTSDVTNKPCLTTNKCLTGHATAPCTAKAPCTTGAFVLSTKRINSFNAAESNGGEGGD